MADFTMSEKEPEKSPLVDTDEVPIALRKDAVVDPYDDDFDNEPRRRSIGLGGLFLFVLIIALAGAGYYGYTDLKGSIEQQNLYGSTEFTKLEKRMEMMLDEIKFKLTTDIEGAKNENIKLSNFLAQTVKKVDNSTAEIAKNNKTLADMQKSYDELTLSLKDLETKHANTAGKLAEAEKRLALLDKITADIAAAESRIKDVEDSLLTVANSLQGISNNITKLSDQIAAVANQQTEFSKNLADVAKSQTSSGQTATNVDTRIKQVQSDIDKANVEILKIKNASDLSVTKELTELRNELGELKRKLDLLR